MCKRTQKFCTHARILDHVHCHPPKDPCCGKHTLCLGCQILHINGIVIHCRKGLHIHFDGVQICFQLIRIVLQRRLIQLGHLAVQIVYTQPAADEHQEHQNQNRDTVEPEKLLMDGWSFHRHNFLRKHHKGPAILSARPLRYHIDYSFTPPITIPLTK